MFSLPNNQWLNVFEVLALAMGWPADKAESLATHYDAAAKEKQIEFPDVVDRLIANGLLDGNLEPTPIPDLASIAHQLYDSPLQESEQAQPENLKKYLFFKRSLQEAIKEDINYIDVRDDDGITVIDHLLKPEDVSEWLEAVQFRSAADLHNRIRELEDENSRLRSELENGNKYTEEIACDYLNIAIKTYFKIWHNRDKTKLIPSQEAICSELHDDYPHLSAITCKAIEKVSCPIERDPSKRKKT